jgi:hypothetical protein
MNEYLGKILDETNVNFINITKGYNIMKILLNIVGVLAILVGTVWFLQGVNILPGSFMSGQTQWAINGGIAFVVGVGLLVFTNRRQASTPENKK